MKVLVLCCLTLSTGFVTSIMLKKECPPDEVHRACNFYEEYTCWENPERVNRVLTSPKRLQHCRSGCYCKPGFVRQYPNGNCISAQHCQNRNIANTLAKIPADFSGFVS